MGGDSPAIATSFTNHGLKVKGTSTATFSNVQTRIPPLSVRPSATKLVSNRAYAKAAIFARIVVNYNDNLRLLEFVTCIWGKIGPENFDGKQMSDSGCQVGRGHPVDGNFDPIENGHRRWYFFSIEKRPPLLVPLVLPFRFIFSVKSFIA